MGIFWLWRQISQIGLLGAPRYSRHVLFSTLLGVCWGVNVVFTIKIGWEMAIFQARMKKSNWCLCQFRLFFFQLTFTGGNPWPNTVPANPFGRKSGVFFCLQFEKVLCLLTSFSYTCTNFFFFWVFLPWKFLVFWTERSAYVQGYNKEHVAIEKWRFFFTFFVVYHEMFCALYIWNF